MREHLVAFVYIMVMACAAFVVMAKPLTAHVMTREDFARRRNLWLAVTAATFLAHDFWLAMLACALIVGLGSRRDPNPVAVYCALLFAVPQFPTPISGFGVINQLFEIDHPRMLALVLLLPAALRLAGSKRAPNPRLLIPDTLFVAYFLYTFIVTATAASVTELMRHSVYLILDHALLYYVITRSVVDRRRLIDVMASFVMAVAVISVVAVFENVRHWLVYESLRPALGVPPPDLTLYLMRATEDGGYMRALTTAGNSIAMGFMAMIAITLHLALLRSYKPRLLGAAVVLMLVGGLLAAVSRGPWMGCAIAVVVGIAFGPGAKKRLLWMLGSLPLIVIALLIVPQGQKFIDLLPFIGTVEPGSVTYRTQLIDRAMIVFWQNPIFGSLHYIHNPVLEVMRQGQGIIDIVNSYIGVALPYGLIGLALFVAPAAYAVSMAALTSQRLAHSDPEGEAAGRALAASMLGILIVIGALSLIVHVPIVHWMFVSLCVAFAANAPNWRVAPVAATRPTALGRALPQRAGQPARPSRHHA